MILCAGISLNYKKRGVIRKTNEWRGIEIEILMPRFLLFDEGLSVRRLGA